MKESLIAKLQGREAVIGVVGLGYVGLPLAIAFAKEKFSVLGFDIDETKTEMLNAGTPYIQHLDPDGMKEVVAAGSLEATTDFDRLRETDAVLICVPTPLTANREPELRYVSETSGVIGKTLKKGQIIVLESTTYPGTTDELVRGILEEESGLVAGEDFFL
ncbi:MAG: NAD(P)-binding domain-containing protein, partial [Myxococcota bacterium]